ncbi:hypothetical protein [Krasilnikovia sp. MM14-A1259]|uniref:hypothetical protein n=1 Tax=Krasilnikovia sp. MM14-A1259 TaxID=3373539 RepID=UPI00399D1C75
MGRRFEVADDSGFLALLDQHAYQGFVDPDWTYDTIFAHFRTAMAKRSLLLWGTGRGDIWTVDIVVGKAAPLTGFRRVTGPIRVSAGQLHLTNYESLTMAAMDRDLRLPELHQRDQVLALPSGVYCCEIVQVIDPDGDLDGPDDEPRTGPDFVIALRAGQEVEAWPDPAWHDG